MSISYENRNFRYTSDLVNFQGGVGRGMGWGLGGRWGVGMEGMGRGEGWFWGGRWGWRGGWGSDGLGNKYKKLIFVILFATIGARG